MVDDGFCREVNRVGCWVEVKEEGFVRLSEFEDAQWGDSSGQRDKCSFAVSSCGGLIAVHTPSNASSTSTAASIALYASGGSSYAVCTEIFLPINRVVQSFAWNNNHDHLIIICESGDIYFYDYCGRIACVSVKICAPFLSCTNTGDRACCASFAGPSSSLTLTLVETENGKSYRPHALSLPPAETAVREQDFFMSFAPSGAIYEEELYVFYTATQDHEPECRCCRFALASNRTRADLQARLCGGIVQQMCTSQNGDTVTLLMSSGRIYLSTRALDATRELVFLARSDVKKVSGMQWCGDSCLCCVVKCDGRTGGIAASSSSLYLISPECERSLHVIDLLPADAVLSIEVDGVRVIGTRYNAFLQLVPPEVAGVFSRKADEPGAVLLMSFDKILHGDASGVRMMNDLQENTVGVQRAIHDCVAAATFEFDVQQQKRLLRAAALGKSACPFYDPDSFVLAARRIRVRNTLFTSSCNIIISHRQLDALGDDRLVLRLVWAKKFQVAHSVAQLLTLNSDEILMSWALEKLKCALASADKGAEAAAAGGVLAKLRQCGAEVSFSELAKSSFMQGFSKAALIFIEAEPVIPRRVSMLLSMGELERALHYAVASLDAELLLTVIHQFIQQRGEHAVEPILQGGSVCQAYLILLARVPSSNMRRILRDYFFVDRRSHVALLLRDLFRIESTIGSAKGGGSDSNSDRANISSVTGAQLVSDIALNAYDAQSRKRAFVQRVISGDNSYGSGTESGEREASGACGGRSLGSEGVGGMSLTSLARVFSSSAGRPAPAALPKKAPTHAQVSLAAQTSSPVFDRYKSFSVSPMRLIRRHAKMMEQQTILAHQFNDTRFFTRSVVSMLRLLVEKGETERAEKLRTEFAVPDKMWRLCLVRAYASMGRWQSIDYLGQHVTTKSVSSAALPAEFFVKTLLSYDQREQAKAYIPHIGRIELRMEYYVRCNDWFAAAVDCRRSNEQYLVQQLKERAKGNSASLQAIERGWNVGLVDAPPHNVADLVKFFR